MDMDVIMKGSWWTFNTYGGVGVIVVLCAFALHIMYVVGFDVDVKFRHVRLDGHISYLRFRFHWCPVYLYQGS